MDLMWFLAISGSLRRASTNTALLEAMAAVAAPEIEVEICRSIGTLPIFNPDREGEETPPEVLEFAAAVADADGLILSVSEYAHGIPGGFKNALDWLVSRSEIPGKPVMLVSASHRGDFVRDALHEVLRTIATRLMPGPGLRVPLLGKKADEIEVVLCNEAVKMEMAQSLRHFVSWIGSIDRDV
jgi:NAD(P)H-dependent FMN reductase